MAEKEKKETRKRGALTASAEEPKKLNGFGFWLIVGIAFCKDLLDVFFTLSVVLGFITGIFSMMLGFVVWLYLFLHGVRFTARILARTFLSLIIELLPVINALPMFTLLLLSIRAVENSRRLRAFTESIDNLRRKAKKFV